MGIISAVKAFLERREQEKIRKAKIMLLNKAFKYILDGRFNYICYALSTALTSNFFIGKIKMKARDELDSFIYSTLKDNTSFTGYAIDVLKEGGIDFSRWEFDAPNMWIWLRAQRLNWMSEMIKALERGDSVLPAPVINIYPDNAPWKKNGS
jgi:hypothetical protein